MGRLVKNELKKIFSRKSFYLILILVFGIICLQTIGNGKINFNDFIDNNNSENNNVSSISQEVESLKEQEEGLNESTYEEALEKVKLKAKLKIFEDIQKVYGEDSWQAYVITNEEYVAFEMYYDYYLFQQIETYFENSEFELNDSDSISEEEAYSNYEEINNIFGSGNWEEFARIQIEKYKTEKSSLEVSFVQTDNEEELIEINRSIKYLEYEIENLNLRIDNEITFGDDYLNDSLDNYLEIEKNMYDYESITDTEKSYEDKRAYQSEVEKLAKNKYVIENKIDTENTNTTRYNLMTMYNVNKHGIIIALLIIYISATIVSREVSKNTLKDLLTKPHSRMAVLFSKFITCLIMSVFYIVITSLMVLIAGIIFKDTGSLNIPVIMYNFSKDGLMEMSILKYVLVQLVTKLPLFLGVAIIGFGMSTIFGNSFISIIISVILYACYPITSYITLNNNVARYALFTNWDLSEMIFGRLPIYNGLNIQNSLIICAVYFIAILVISFLLFSIRDVKVKRKIKHIKEPKIRV